MSLWKALTFVSHHFKSRELTRTMSGMGCEAVSRNGERINLAENLCRMLPTCTVSFIPPSTTADEKDRHAPPLGGSLVMRPAYQVSRGH